MLDSKLTELEAFLREHVDDDDANTVKEAMAEIERLRRRVQALEHLIVEECDPHDMADIPNAMLAQTARDAVARRATEAFSDEQKANP
jgi:hypothetical protein